jgi:hypothetical protein
LFMDSDVVPLCYMDYVFDLSEPEQGEPSLFKENLIISFSRLPGLFMLTPGGGEWEQVEQIIKKSEEEDAAELLKQGKRPFDPVVGWGHEIVEPDYWLRPGDGKKLKLWQWYGDLTDQGLLYYWTKYWKKSVSIVLVVVDKNNVVEN